MWLEVPVHYSQLSLLLRHALSCLRVTKLSQPASPNGFSCLGDPAPSWRAAAGLPFAHLHGVSAELQRPASAQSCQVSGRKCPCPSLQQPQELWNNTTAYLSAQISHRVPFRSTGAMLFLKMPHGTGPNQLENQGWISQFIPQEQLLQKTQIFQAHENVTWIHIGSKLSCKLHPLDSPSKKTTSNLLSFKIKTS